MGWVDIGIEEQVGWIGMVRRVDVREGSGHDAVVRELEEEERLKRGDILEGVVDGHDGVWQEKESGR